MRFRNLIEWFIKHRPPPGPSLDFFKICIQIGCLGELIQRFLILIIVTFTGVDKVL